MKEPIYNVSYLGKHFGLSSMTCDIGTEWPVLAVWKRTEKDVSTFDDLGILFPWPYLNGKAVSMYNHQEPVGVHWNSPSATLQHQNKMIYVVRPPERVFAGEFCNDGISSFSSRISVFTHGSRTAPLIHINGKQVSTFPVTAKTGDVIAIDQGASYIGLIPLRATNLGRTCDVRITYEWPRLNIEAFVLDAETPLPNTDESWEQLNKATAGWVIEMGDRETHESFGQFQNHMRAATLKCQWDTTERIISATYRSGDDILEVGVSTAHERITKKERYIRPELMLKKQLVNGKWPWPSKDIDIDCPLGQMGKGPLLAKGGATLRSKPGQMAMLRIEPISGTYEAINPFTDPQPMHLVTPEGVAVRSEGPMGCGRITVRPKGQMLWIDYHLPPPEGDIPAGLLKSDALKGATAGGSFEKPLADLVGEMPGIREARRISARALLVKGLGKKPTVVLNGSPVGTPPRAVVLDGDAWLRIPIAPKDSTE